MDEQPHLRRRLRRTFQIAASAALAAVLGAVLLGEAGAMTPMGQALGYGYDGYENPTPTPTPTPTATPEPPQPPPVASPAPPARDTTPPTARSSWRLTARARRTLLRSGRLVTTLTVSEPSRVSQGLYRAKRKQPLASAPTTRVLAGKVKLTLRLKAKDRKALRRSKARLEVRTSLVDVAGNLGTMGPLSFKLKRGGR